MNFEPLYAPSLKDLFVQKLQGMILSGELPMGEKLPSERELCQQMGVSRAVVNGGITELARQGFLEVRPRQGAYVADYRRDGNMEHSWKSWTIMAACWAKRRFALFWKYAGAGSR